MSDDTAWSPNTDVFETESELVIKMEIPGIGKEDIEIALENRTLTIRGERGNICHGGKCCYRQLEIEYGQFEREIALPDDVDESQVRANYHNGFLHIVFAKEALTKKQSVRVMIDH